MQTFRQILVFAFSVFLLGVGGCGEPLSSDKSASTSDQDKKAASKKSPPVAKKSASAASDPPKKTKKDPLIKRSFINPDSASASSVKFAGLTEEMAVEGIVGGIRDSLKVAPTMVVWLFDQSNSAFKVSTAAQAAVTSFYEELGASSADDDSAPDLLSAVVAFGSEVEFLTEAPTGNPQEVIDAINSFRRDSSGQEVTFAAVKAALDKYVDFRTKERRELMFVVVTDECGDDPQKVDDVVADFKKYSIPVYVIGVPAPFGRSRGLKEPLEESIRQGPESRHPQRVQLASWSARYGTELLDSGFGPYDLERLCYESRGRFLALRPGFTGESGFIALETDWPSRHTYRFDPEIMRRYRPKYVSQQRYEASLNENRAKMALDQAAKLEMTETLRYPPVEFLNASQAELNRKVGEAQKVAARLDPVINKLHLALEQGEDDRAKLTEPRWQAGYDLALGRVLAAKARIAGYNSMLAALKRGMTFENPGSNRWHLETVPVTEDAGSSLKKMGLKAREYLSRVVKEHPGTPWARIAQRELETEIGWKWVEKGPGE